MPDVAFKDLCLDVSARAGRRSSVTAFWSAALGQLVAEERDDGVTRLDPPLVGPKGRMLWINVVPEPSTVKSRVHLDLRLPGGDPGPLLGLGGRAVRAPTGDDPWWVIEDPDGLVLCVFGPDAGETGPAAAVGPFELVVDSPDPERIATWWAQRTGATIERAESDVVLVGAAGFPYRWWVFQEVPEPKTAKNRMHWDVLLADATVEDLVAAGATVLRRPDREIRWTVLADPDGNEFCAFG